MKEIQEKLLEIQEQENVRIFYACESGSRAWGFPSVNSDYDVRFLYARPRDWYLSVDVEDRRDVIELPIEGDLDITGWDVRKALKLLRKSNPPLLEWLTSPIVYMEDREASDKIRSLVPKCYSPTAYLYHYLQMARGNFREYLKRDLVPVKKYFYVLRPLLAIKWIEEKSDVMPMEFGKLLTHGISPSDLRKEIETLIERKKNGQELDHEPKIAIINDFIERELKRLEPTILDKRSDKLPIDSVNEVFRNIVDRSEIANRKSQI